MISAILLAAGQSSRMNGENKLSKEIDGIPLIKYAIKNILGSSVDELIIVLGYERKVIESLIDINKKTKIIFNKNFKDGIASSIKAGIGKISKKSDAFFICLGDMPNVNQNIYNKLIKTRSKYNKKLKIEHKKEIIIPTNQGQKGTPVLFSKFMKDKFKNIEGDFGAKKIIELYEQKILNVPIDNDGINLDFDTKEDFML